MCFQLLHNNKNQSLLITHLASLIMTIKIMKGTSCKFEDYFLLFIFLFSVIFS